AGRIVERPDQTRRALDEYERLALVPCVVAERDHISARVDEFPIDHLGDAKAAGGVLAIDDDKIELPLAHEPRQAFGHDPAAAAADNVADKKQAHQLRFRDNRLARVPSAPNRALRRVRSLERLESPAPQSRAPR